MGRTAATKYDDQYQTYEPSRHCITVQSDSIGRSHGELEGLVTVSKSSRNATKILSWKTTNQLTFSYKVWASRGRLTGFLGSDVAFCFFEAHMHGTLSAIQV
jgi:hypothetical protein